MAFNLDDVRREFTRLKQDNLDRNHQYFLQRQAVKGNFEWPRNWPIHIDRTTKNMCKPITERMSNYLMGKGFNWNVNRPNSLDYRDAAERTEKVLEEILRLSKADIQFMEGAKTGSKLGRTVFKVYKRGKKGAEHACFSYCQPDFFYGVPLGAENPGEFSIVYYSYPLDIDEARRRYGNRTYRTEKDIAESDRYDTKRENADSTTAAAGRRVPVLEVWTPESYLLSVGGSVIYNGDNPFKREKTGEGFIPFVVIENIRQDEEGYGESDIAQARVLNNKLNWLVSRQDHVVGRWLNPTVVWEGAPQNYAEILAQSIAGGGAIPTRLGSNLGFLSYDNQNQLVDTHVQMLMQAILEVSGMNDAAYQGVVQGSINTGPALEVQFQPLLSTIEKKRLEWTAGLESLFSMLLEVQESIGDSTALGEVVVGQTRKSVMAMPGADGEQGRPGDGEIVQLSGKDIKGLRSVSIFWPGVLPKDDFAASNLEVTKLERGLQSVYTTMEKLGEEYPNDEIDRIRQENTDPSLRGEKVAEQVRAATPLMKQQQDQQFQMAQMAMEQQAQQAAAPPAPAPQTQQAQPQMDPALLEAAQAQQGDIGARMRQLARSTAPSLDDGGDFPEFGAQGGSGY